MNYISIASESIKTNFSHGVELFKQSPTPIQITVSLVALAAISLFVYKLGASAQRKLSEIEFSSLIPAYLKKSENNNYNDNNANVGNLNTETLHL